MKKKKVIFGLIGLAAVILGFLGKLFYREYVYSHGINDFGIADTLPSYFYVVGFALLLLLQTSDFPQITIGAVTIASILFETKQFYSKGVFDAPDVLASVAGGITAAIVVKMVNRRVEKET